MRSRIVRAAARPTKKAPVANFTGVVLQDEVFVPEAPSRMRASKVTFAPGARTNWHTHAVGQVLHVLSGVGRYQLEGEPIQVLLPASVYRPNLRPRAWTYSASAAMPDGKRRASATIAPCGSRLACQQSSTIT